MWKAQSHFKSTNEAEHKTRAILIGFSEQVERDIVEALAEMDIAVDCAQARKPGDLDIWADHELVIIEMPANDAPGFSLFCQSIHSENSLTQIIAIADNPDPEEVKSSLQAGACDCLKLPIHRGAVQRSVSNALRIRELARANKTLAEASEIERYHFDNILNHAGTAIIETSPELTILFVNRAAERVLGIDRSEIVNRGLLDVFYPDPDYAIGVREIYESTVLAGLAPNHVFQTTIQSKDGEERTIRWTASTYPSAEGLRIVNVAEDMSHAATLEERVRSLIGQLNHNNHLLHTINEKNERLQTMVRQYIPRTVWERADLHASQGAIKIAPQRSERTCVFLDIAGFTSFSEQNDSTEVIRFLNQAFAGITQVIYRFHGDIDKFMGDACFAIFESPLDACKAALKVQIFMHRLNGVRTEAGKISLPLRCGISTGAVIRGNVGGHERKDNTLIGDAVNTASRLESLCVPGRVLIGETTYKQVQKDVETSGENLVQIRGKANPIHVYYIRNINQTQPITQDAEAKYDLTCR
ncbi:MAG: PAS domain S-box protein [Spirochaetia bacterium]|nr:PAS domain S-box protein [Spirochaetia bacterium]